jgi:hypothetical protein
MNKDNSETKENRRPIVFSYKMSFSYKIEANMSEDSNGIAMSKSKNSAVNNFRARELSGRGWQDFTV